MVLVLLHPTVSHFPLFRESPPNILLETKMLQQLSFLCSNHKIKWQEMTKSWSRFSVAEGKLRVRRNEIRNIMHPTKEILTYSSPFIFPFTYYSIFLYFSLFYPYFPPPFNFLLFVFFIISNINKFSISINVYI